MQLLTLQNDQLRLEVAPAIGGSVARLDFRAATGALLPILRPVSAGDLVQGGAVRAAMHPLVPFANRVPGNRIDLVSPPVILEPNIPGEPCALHGIGWQRPWQVVEANAAACQLELVVEDGDWAFPFRSLYRLTLDGATLQVQLTVENISDRPIPAGIGFHPYFHRAPGTTLRFAADHFWLEGPGHLPSDAISLPPELDFADGRPLPENWRNNCYSGWNGRLLIEDAARGLAIDMTASPSLPELMVYTPPGAPFYCLEPQSHTTAANGQGTAAGPKRPLQLLRPGESLAGDMALTVSSRFAPE